LFFSLFLCVQVPALNVSVSLKYTL
jgi:hypothetical protein